MAGMTTTPKLTHSLLLSVGALLVLRGLWQIGRRAALFAALSFLLLVFAAALTPPSVMSGAHEPWYGAQIIGGLLYLLFAGFLGYAFWVGFPAPLSPRPAARAIALGGTAASIGCACCMVTGAIAGLAVTAGGSPDLFLKNGFTYFLAIAIAGLGLALFAGPRPIPWLIAGAHVTHYGTGAIGLLDGWMFGDVNLRFILTYAVFDGVGLVMKSWTVAYEPITRTEPIPAITPEPAF